MAPRERSLGPLLVAVLVAAALLRGWLAFGSPLAADTFFDERFSFRNVHDLVARGRIQPDNAYYPSLSYLPHSAVLALAEAAHRVTGIETLSIYDRRRADGFSATAYALARSISVVVGTFSVWLVFLFGRRLFDARVGLVAATLLAAAPNHVLNSAHFKPDVLVDLLALATLWWSLNAILDPSLRRYLVAGCGVGLAAAAKYNGAGVAVPLALGTLVTGRERRRWPRLALAGLVSIGVFLALNPFLGTVVEYLGRQVEMYDHRGRIEGWTFWGMMLETARLVVVNLRWPLALLAAAGGASLAVRALRRAVPRRERLESATVLFFVLGYPALYAASTTLFRDQNVLTVVSLSCLLAAWPAVALWDALQHRVLGGARASVRRRAGIAAWTVLALAVLAYPAKVVYARVVPTTFERAEVLLRADLDPLHLRHVYYERWESEEGPPRRLRPGRGGRYAATVEVESLSAVTPDALDRSDAEVFRARRTETGESAFHLDRIAGQRGRARRIEPEPFRFRGPSLGALLHPWTLEGEPRALRLLPAGAPGRYRAAWEDAGPGGLRGGSHELVSLSLWLPVAPGQDLPREVRLGERRAPLFPTQGLRDRVHMVSGRVEPPAGNPFAIELLDGGVTPDPEAVEAELCLWSPPSQARQGRRGGRAAGGGDSAQARGEAP